ncbi:hypothetical protein M408DRAFT_332165 [Serendipita vermifera MAFF 305830]|uniref:HMG box domain-containing protein n=1 Tax=Serendipita vermifera MAFF 305830 TaxID=933852 RepID=A0A0C2X2W3_SERVB|nr:hypothetical protein M408DRAFT_332165 [Serendipita vermifera MAFF 305830]
MPVTRASSNKARLGSGSGSDQASLIDVTEPVEVDDKSLVVLAATPPESSTTSDSPVFFAIEEDSKAGIKRKRPLNWEKDNRPPRPANAFISFKSALKDGPHKREYAARLATGENIGVIAQQMWKALSEDERDSWYATARRAKLEHSKKYPDYKYQPRKGKDRIKSFRARFGLDDIDTKDGIKDEEDDEGGGDEGDGSEDAESSLVRVKQEYLPSAFTPSSDLSDGSRSTLRGEPRLVEVYQGAHGDLDLLYQNGWKWALIREYGDDAADELDDTNPIVHVPTDPESSQPIELISMASVLNEANADPETSESDMDLHHTGGEAAMFQQMFSPWDFPPQPSAFCYDGQPIEASEGVMKLAST